MVTVPHKRSSWYPWHFRGWENPHVKAHPLLNRVHDGRTLGERMADRIAVFGGSPPFIFMFLGLLLCLALLDTLVIGKLLQHQFDPYRYIALNLALSGLAGLQAPIITMSRNRAGAGDGDGALAEHHYEETQRVDRLVAVDTDPTVALGGRAPASDGGAPAGEESAPPSGRDGLLP